MACIQCPRGNSNAKLAMTNLTDRNTALEDSLPSHMLPESVNDVLNRMDCNYSNPRTSIAELTISIQTLRRSIDRWHCYLSTYYKDKVIVFGRLCKAHMFCDIMGDKLDCHKSEHDDECLLLLEYEEI